MTEALACGAQCQPGSVKVLVAEIAWAPAAQRARLGEGAPLKPGGVVAEADGRGGKSELGEELGVAPRHDSAEQWPV
ncbi:MAG: hypothetical protein ACRDOH_34495, partial [Streptosporangiaceae bacterium]